MDQALNIRVAAAVGGSRRRQWATSADRSAFVLVEVLLSLAILGIACLAFMKSFTYSLNAARKMEIMTQATFFAAQLMDEFEIFPPAEGATEGNFGDAYKNYSFRVEMQYVEPSYPALEPPDEVAQFFAERRLRIEIVYNDGVHQPYKAVDLETAIMGFEKFSSASKLSYANF